MVPGRGVRIRVAHLCFADARGGAAIGAYALHRAMLAQGVESRLYVCRKYTNDDTVIELFGRPCSRAFRERLAMYVNRLAPSGNPVLRSYNLFPTGAAKVLDATDVDIIQMHWVNADTISIGEIAALKKPVVWKLPDMWAFSGAEHYMLPGDPERYRFGYRKDNRPSHERGLDVNRWLWNYKLWRWKDASFTIVAPSRWLARCAKESVLFRGMEVHWIINPIDLKIYRPLDWIRARARFGIPSERRMLLFAALNATSDRRKGFHHLRKALSILDRKGLSKEWDLMVMGAASGVPETIEGFRVHSLGKLEDEESVVEGYNTADAFVLPTEMDNLPNGIKEATACGIPCIGFDVGGVPDMIAHEETGWLARPFDAEDLARGIEWTMRRSAELREPVRRRAEMLHDPSTCVNRYMQVYESVLARRS